MDLSPKFQQTIRGVYGERGTVWLRELPRIISEATKAWGLSDLEPVQNLSYGYVLMARQGHRHVVLKLCPDHNLIANEIRALKAFENHGAIPVLAHDEGALLLERAIPGYALKDLFPDREEEANRIACDVIRRLHQTPHPTEGSFPHLRDWLSLMNKDWDIPQKLLDTARTWGQELLNSSPGDVLLHGDFHHENILAHETADGLVWYIIDPKGIMGDPAYEVAPFIYNPAELLSQLNARALIETRIHTFSQNLKIDPKRIAQWFFVQSILGWVWCLDDHEDPSNFVALTKIMRV